MKDRFQTAIVRPPAPSFAAGLTTAALGAPDYGLALQQHAAYCSALEQCGVALIRLEPDAAYPDATFVEDTAIVTNEYAMLTRPGAPSRRGETETIANTLSHLFPRIEQLSEPATLDGGDVCRAGNHYFIGLSERTNEAGAEQLSDFLGSFSHTSTVIDIRKFGRLLHLKSGIAYLGDNRLVVVDDLAQRSEFNAYELLRINPEESYAANALRVNNTVLIAKGYPQFAATLNTLGLSKIELEMSEFQKMDGGLSCLSLRF